MKTDLTKWAWYMVICTALQLSLITMCGLSDKKAMTKERLSCTVVASVLAYVAIFKKND